MNYPTIPLGTILWRVAYVPRVCPHCHQVTEKLDRWEVDDFGRAMEAEDRKSRLRNIRRGGGFKGEAKCWKAEWAHKDKVCPLGAYIGVTWCDREPEPVMYYIVCVGIYDDPECTSDGHLIMDKARVADCFLTEAEAQAECKRRNEVKR